MSRATDWLRSIRAKFTATPGTAVTGIDQHRLIMRVAGHIHDTALKNADKMREQDAKWKYTERESFVALVRRTGEHKESVRPRYRATTVTEVGEKGAGHVWAEDWDMDGLESELRLALAQHFVAKGLVRDFDDARERAALCEIVFDRSFALGSKGFL